MYLSEIKINGFKPFSKEFCVNLNKGITVLLGENGSGKSAIIDAIRLVLSEDEYGRAGVVDSHFHRSIDQSSKNRGANKITIRCEFDDLNETEQVAYLPWLDINKISKSILNYSADNKEDYQGKYKRKIWGNESESGLFEWELLNKINCIYLPPLRDAEDKLRAFRGSRLARLLKNLRGSEEEMHPLEKKFLSFNKELLKDESIKSANKSINANIKKSVGLVFGQDTSIQFTEVNFNRIVERLRLLFYPSIKEQSPAIDLFRELNENSLGLNNILYVATILAELEGLNEQSTFHKILLIEEPEAHLHPQLQVRLFQYLEEKSKDDKIQIIITTHSATIAAAVDLDSIKVLTVKSSGSLPVITSLNKCGCSPETKDFLKRWLDITKSTLLFAKGILFVEGIAEALVIKELAKMILHNLNGLGNGNKYHESLEEYGFSIINLNGIYFRHFFPLFQGYKRQIGGMVVSTDYIPIKCVGITDNDPKPPLKPTPSQPQPGTNPQLYLVNELMNHSKYCRLFYNLKTFEYDLAMEGNNLALMAEVQLSLVYTDGSVRSKLVDYQRTDWTAKTENERANAAHWLLDHIDKGEFALKLSQKLKQKNVSFVAPKYIVDAIQWLVS